MKTNNKIGGSILFPGIFDITVEKRVKANSVFRPIGRFFVQCFNKDGVLIWTEDIKNITVDEGLTDILDVYFSDGTQKNTWYLGLKGTNQTPAAGWDAAGIGSDFTEFVAYDEATREEWVEAGVTAKTITNSASPAEFTINDSGTVYGAFVVSTNTKSGTTGVLWCVSDFSIARVVVDDDIVRVVYSIASVDV
jgi:hypothetical protein